MVQTNCTPFRRRTLACALLLAFAQPGLAESDMQALDETLRQDLLTPDSRLSVGLGNLSGEHRRFGSYRGFDGDGIYALVDADLERRTNEGTSLRFSGRNLGLDTRSLHLDGERQGSWRIGFDYRRMVRREPLTPLTGLTGVGTGTQTLNGTAIRPLELELTRDVFAVGGRRYFAQDYSVRVSFRQEERGGDRLYGHSFPMDFLAEPIDRTMRSWELVAAKGGKNLQWTAGYAGSSFTNDIPGLTVIGGGFPESALPPDNQAHQLNASLGYDFSPSTRATAKLSYEAATQNASFIVPGVQPSLNGKIVTTRLFTDLTTRLTDELDLVANLRYDNRDDKTPVVRYLTPAAPSAAPGLFTAGVTGFNVPRDLETLDGTLEASYRLATDLRLSGGIERQEITRQVPDTYRRVAYRRKTDETTARVGILRMLSETLNGSVSYLHSERRGSEYIPDTYAASSNQIHPMIWADRQRDKLRLTADWIPGEDWSVQGIGDISQDRYNGRNLGPRDGSATFVSLDASYTISFRWTLSAWVSQERSRAEQSTRTQLNNVVAGGEGTENVIWDAQLQQTTTAFGITLRGRPLSQLALAAELSRSTDKAEHDLAQIGGTGTVGPNSLPDYRYRATTLKLSGDYSIDRFSGVQVEIIADRRENNDWTWLGWTYSDGTTVTNPAEETAVFAGLRYRYRWR